MTEHMAHPASALGTPQTAPYPRVVRALGLPLRFSSSSEAFHVLEINTIPRLFPLPCMGSVFLFISVGPLCLLSCSFSFPLCS